jgi:lipopolysaccharide export system permease protein
MRILRYLHLITEGGASVFSVLQISFYILISVFLTILPIALPLVVILTYNKLLETREIIILRNAGLTKFDLLKPILLLSIFVTAFSFFLTLYEIPKSNEEIIKIKDSIWNTVSFNLFQEGSFVNFNDFTFYTDKREKNFLSNVLIYKKDRVEDIFIQAQNVLIAGKNIKLFNGFIEKGRLNEFLFFDDYVVNIGDLLEEEEEEKERYNIYSIPTNKLIEIYSNLSKSTNFSRERVVYEISFRFLYPLSIILIVLLSASMILSGNFDRVSNKKSVINATLFSTIVFISILFFVKQIKKDEIYAYFVTIEMIIVFMISIFLIRERNTI